MSLSKSQLDKLGERLKNENISDADLRALNDYRLCFDGSYSEVIASIRTQLSLEPTGRPAKSTTSISDKLRRESIRLSQIQDIAGCRVVVENLESQNTTANALQDLFPGALVLDRRIKPSHGYRAVHVVVTAQDKRVEVQVRTALQHLWAELCEKLADRVDKSIKYGGGGKEIAESLSTLSVIVSKQEETESSLTALQQKYAAFHQDLPEKERELIFSAKLRVDEIETNLRESRDRAVSIMRTMIALCED